MPISRKKACAQCRQSKLRCDLVTPTCTRCSRRRLRCAYETFGYAASPYARPSDAPVDARSESSALFSFADSLSMHSSSLGVDMIPFAGNGEQDWNPSLEALTGREMAPDSISLGLYSSGAHSLPTLQKEVPYSLEMAIPPAFLEAEQPLLPLALPDNKEPPVRNEPEPKSRLIQAPSQIGRRGLRRRGIVRDCVLTSVVIGQLTSYPKMMIEGDLLPPYIHPPCHTDEELAPQCRSSGRHQCLHTTLSICGSLLDMFYARTAASADFVWRNVYMELNRLKKKACFPTLDPEGKLVAAQSVTTFLLLQAADTQSAEKNDVIFLLNTALELLLALANMPEYKAESFHSPPSRKEWIFRESIHRLITIYSVIDLLLEGLESPPGLKCEPGRSLSESVLPCHRELWEARTTGAWVRSYEEYTSKRASDSTLRVGTLLDTSISGCHTTLVQNNIDQAIFSDILKWCEKLDSLGTLVYMVIPLQQNRLTNSAWESSHVLTAPDAH